MIRYEFPYTVYHTTDPEVKGTIRWTDTKTAVEWQRLYASHVERGFKYRNDTQALKDFMATHDVEDKYWPNSGDE
jgi:hypothetical protein